MTEAEWRTTSDAERLLRFLQFGTAGRLGAGLARLVGRRNAARDQKLRAFVWHCFSRTESAYEFERAELARGVSDPVFVAHLCCQIASDNAEAGGRDGPADVVPPRT